jgi:hypothetical protein
MSECSAVQSRMKCIIYMGINEVWNLLSIAAHLCVQEYAAATVTHAATAATTLPTRTILTDLHTYIHCSITTNTSEYALHSGRYCSSIHYTTE